MSSKLEAAFNRWQEIASRHAGEALDSDSAAQNQDDTSALVLAAEEMLTLRLRDLLARRPEGPDEAKLWAEAARQMPLLSSRPGWPRFPHENQHAQGDFHLRLGCGNPTHPSMGELVWVPQRGGEPIIAANRAWLGTELAVTLRLTPSGSSTVTNWVAFSPRVEPYMMDALLSEVLADRKRHHLSWSLRDDLSLSAQFACSICPKWHVYSMSPESPKLKRLLASFLGDSRRPESVAAPALRKYLSV